MELIPVPTSNYTIALPERPVGSSTISQVLMELSRHGIGCFRVRSHPVGSLLPMVLRYLEHWAEPQRKQRTEYSRRGDWPSS